MASIQLLEKTPIEDDIKLIRYLQSQYDNVEFIGYSKKYCESIIKGSDNTGSLINQLDSSINLHNGENVTIALKLWKHLLSDAIIHLKSKDTRERYHDGESFGIDEIYKLLEAFKEFETLLYGATEYYRDHITHVIRIYILGDYLIRNSFGYSNIDIGCPDFNTNITPEEKESMWCIISLTHDLGYALEKIENINEQVGKMVRKYGKVNLQELSYIFPPQCQIINEFLLKVLSSKLIRYKNESDKYCTHIQSKYYLKFARAYEKYDHGVISSSVLMRELVYFLETDYMLDTNKPLDKEDAKQFLIRQNILRAIAAHNCNDIYHLTIPNFSCILSVADEMQEWGRPRLSDVFKRNMPKTSLLINRFDERKIDYEVRFSYDQITPQEEDELARDVIEYFIRKSEKYIKIFRSAVGGNENIDPRIIDFTFKVTKRGKTSESYTLILPQPNTRDKKLSVEVYRNNQKTSIHALKTDTQS